MKKQWLLLAMLLGTALVLPGCGKNSEEAVISLAEGYVAPYSVDTDFFADKTEEEPEDTQDVQTEADGISDRENSEKEITGSGIEEKVEEEIDTKEETGTGEETGTEEEQDGDDVQTGKTVTLSGNEKTDYDVEIVELTGVESNISITYPVISGWDNVELEQYWNDVFFEAAAAECRQAKSGDAVSMEAIVANKSKKVCSIVIKGGEYWEGSAHPYGFCTTYNIDMESGKKLCLEDFADTDELAELLLGEDGFKISEKDVNMDDIFAYNFLEGKPTEKTLSENLANFDKTYEERTDMADGFGIFGSSFLDDGKITLVLEVNHAMGDYVWVTVE